MKDIKSHLGNLAEMSSETRGRSRWGKGPRDPIKRKDSSANSFPPKCHYSSLILLIATLALIAAGARGSELKGFEPIFDGVSLAGWETPEPRYWTVTNGAIVGRITAEQPCETNQYLVWRGGELADFELVLKSRLRGEGGINNGFQFRSRLMPDHDICGYQVDNNLQTPWLVRLYDEYGRHALAWRGESATFDGEGRRKAAPLTEADGEAWFKLEEWHEYHLTCIGRKITLRVDGRLAAEVQDNDERRFEPQGIFALQLHSGPPTEVEFKDIRLKVLKPAEAKRATARSEREMALRREAAAWWGLDTGGHGAKPALRHIPAFDKFELNVRAAGPKARPGGNVVLMHGAHFESTGEIDSGEEQVTVYLRARDPQGTWNAALMSAGGFRLAGSQTPGSDSGEIVFTVRTDAGEGSASFPISRMERAAWHNLAGRYDGKTVELFCGGQRMAKKAWRGKIARDRSPTIIAAEAEAGKMARHFEGELEEAAIWPRALTDEEIASLEPIAR